MLGPPSSPSRLSAQSSFSSSLLVPLFGSPKLLPSNLAILFLEIQSLFLQPFSVRLMVGRSLACTQCM
ncbi:hypothetical protein I315_05647 [Cryptococcus gattii Ru294]|nr:hypothetical protein I315_05647 [Cryptococcus gattii Ru294]